MSEVDLHALYTITTGLFTKGVTGVGMPIRNLQGEVKAALSVCAISERMKARRRAEIAELLKSEIDCIVFPDDDYENSSRMKPERAEG